MNKEQLKQVVLLCIPFELECFKRKGYKLTKKQFDNLNFKIIDACLYGQLFNNSNGSDALDFKDNLPTFPVNIKGLNMIEDGTKFTAFEIFSYHNHEKSKLLLIEYGIYTPENTDDSLLTWE